VVIPIFCGEHHEARGSVAALESQLLGPSLGYSAMVLEEDGRVVARISVLSNPGLWRQQVARISQNRQARIHIGIA
jgi:hypothetical protein